jgi:hypothetical protein
MGTDEITKHHGHGNHGYGFVHKMVETCCKLWQVSLGMTPNIIKIRGAWLASVIIFPTYLLKPEI